MQRKRRDEAATDLSVAIVCGSLSRAAGGIFPIIQAHTRELASLGVSVRALGVTDAFSEADAASWGPVVPQLYNPQYRGFAYSPELSRAMLSAPVDIIHQHGLWLYPSIATSRWRRRCQRPVVISTQGMLEPWALSNSKAKKFVAGLLFERNNLSQASCLHCSQAEVEGLRRFGLKNPIAVLPNGTDLPDLSLAQTRPSWLPDDGRRTLLFLGRVHPKKGIRETLEAWALLRACSPEIAQQWRLVIAGWDDGGHKEPLVSQARNLGIADDVLFAGPVFGEEKEALLSHADAFILASYSEGLPMAVLEAWSHALPVFMTRECNLMEGFSAGAAVEVTTDPAKLASTLKRSLESRELPSIGMRGRQLAEQKFSWDAMVRELLDVYLWLTRGADRPACVLV